MSERCSNDEQSAEYKEILQLLSDFAQISILGMLPPVLLNDIILRHKWRKL